MELPGEASCRVRSRSPRLGQLGVGLLDVGVGMDVESSVTGMSSWTWTLAVATCFCEGKMPALLGERECTSTLKKRTLNLALNPERKVLNPELRVQGSRFRSFCAPPPQICKLS